MPRLTLEVLFSNMPNEDFIDPYLEVSSGIVPATGAAHGLCRKINRMIDQGELCINPTTYRKVYLPTLVKYMQKELSRRYVDALLKDAL